MTQVQWFSLNAVFCFRRLVFAETLQTVLVFSVRWEMFSLPSAVTRAEAVCGVKRSRPQCEIYYFIFFPFPLSRVFFVFLQRSVRRATFPGCRPGFSRPLSLSLFFPVVLSSFFFYFFFISAGAFSTNKRQF